jgi:hypothetical protein
MPVNADVEALVNGCRPLRPMLAVCPEPGCTRLTMGGTCVEHDTPVSVTYPRGRPFDPELPRLDEHLAARV